MNESSTDVLFLDDIKDKIMLPNPDEEAEKIVEET